jgi:hypothetical protein
MEDQGADGRIILKHILKKYKVMNAFIGVRIGTGSGFL